MTAVGTSVLRWLRRAGLRPSTARIGVLQVLEAAAPHSLRAEEIYRQMALRGTPTSIGTIYRALHDFEARGLLLRGWDGNRTAHYRVKPARADACPLRLMCPDSGRVVALDEPGLHAGLLEAARRAGVALDGLALSVQAADAATPRPARPMRPTSMAHGA